MSKTYAIADLHGRFDLLCRTIDLIEADAGDEGGTFVCLGDFVDRGPQSRSIIDLLMAGPQRPNWRWIVLQGNHEAMMLEVLANTTPHLLKWWVGNGGGQTLQSYGYEHGDVLHPLRIPAEHIEWLSGLPVHHEDAHRFYVHAGVIDGKPLAEQSRDTMQWMLYGDDDPGGFNGKHVVHGHHQFAHGPIIMDGRTDLDTFAWYSGRLSIGVFDDEKSGAPVRIMDAIGKPISRAA